MTSVAMTDHGNMFGDNLIFITQWEQKDKSQLLVWKLMFTIALKSLGDKTNRQRFHLCLYAKDEVGYKNLMYLSSKAYGRFYYYPRINKQLLKRVYSAGLVCRKVVCLQRWGKLASKHTKWEKCKKNQKVMKRQKKKKKKKNCFRVQRDIWRWFFI